MKIKITGREGIEAFAKQPFSPQTALISITDSNSDFAALEHKPDELLQLRFDDISSQDAQEEFERHMGRKPTEEERHLLSEKFHLLSDAQARQIAAFVHRVKDDAQLLICQCEYGQSRSAAVAAAVLEHLQRRGIVVFADPRYFPNKLVFKKVYGALNRLAKEGRNGA